MFCSNCGTEIKDGTKFCPNCGMNIKLNDKILNDSDKNIEASKGTELKLEHDKTKGNKIKWIFIPIVLGLIVVFLFLSKKEEAEVAISNVYMQETGWGNADISLSVINSSDVAIKSVTIGALAWDVDGLPLSIPTDPLFATYFAEERFQAVNIMPTSEGEINFQTWADISEIHYFMPVILAYTDYDGHEWESSDYKKYMKMSGEMLNDYDNPEILIMEFNDNNDEKEYIFEDSNERYLEREELLGLSEEEVLFAYYEIPARLGAEFNEDFLKGYFADKSWYEPSISFDDFHRDMFNEYEVANLTTISDYINEIWPESEDSVNETESNFGTSKEMTGMYEIKFGPDGGAELEILYESDSDVYRVVFSGSYGMNAGFTEGYLVAYTDGTDGIWDYYEDGAMEMGNYNPSMRLYYDGSGYMTVEVLDESTFGGVGFPGFSGDYTQIKEYGMP